MQADGQLVIYAPTGADVVWSEGAGVHGGWLTVQDDGNMVIVADPQGRPMWSTKTGVPVGPLAIGHRMRPGQVLNPGQSLRSANGQFVLTGRVNGDLVLTHGGARVSESDTRGRGVGGVNLQADGHLVIYGRNGVVVWAPDYVYVSDSTLVVQDDGNVVVYGPTGAMRWETGLPIN